MFIFDIKWSTTTAGPSPFNNERTELFLLGCEKARLGNPCKGCFNQATWVLPKDATSYDPVACANNIIKHAPNKFLTIGGGEPSDQLQDLIIMCRILKTHGFHILCYTWRDVLGALQGVYGKTFKKAFQDLLNTIDGLIDGEFVLEKKCYRTDLNDGLFNSIGSTNQRLVLKNNHKIYVYSIGAIKTITFEDQVMKIKGEGCIYDDIQT